MFEQSFVAMERRRAWPVLASSAAQLVVLSGALLVPLVWIEAIPLLRNEAPPLPPPRPPKGVKVVDAKRFSAAPAARMPRLPYAPPGHKYAPVGMTLSDAEGGVEGIGNLAQGVGPGMDRLDPERWMTEPAAPPPPPPPPEKTAKAAAPTRITVGGLVIQSKLVHQIRPAYPPLAKQARIQGQVLLSAVISREGRIQELRLVSGHPLLAPAAMAAVRQWLYSPTLLNGDPVEVLTTIEVNFTLAP